MMPPDRTALLVMDYQPGVLGDACADRDADVHAFPIEKILPRQATVISTAELGERLSATP